MVSASILKGQRGVNMSLKPCLNACSQKWVKSKRNLVDNLALAESLTLKVFLWTGLINFNNVLRNRLYKAELQMSGSNLFHS